MDKSIVSLNKYVCQFGVMFFAKTVLTVNTNREVVLDKIKASHDRQQVAYRTFSTKRNPLVKKCLCPFNGVNYILLKFFKESNKIGGASNNLLYFAKMCQYD